MEAQLIVKLQEIRNANDLPAPHQAGDNLLILFGSLRFNVNAMAVKIHHIERIEFAVILDIPWTDKVSLMNVIKIERLGKIRVLDSFRNIRSFF